MDYIAKNRKHSYGFIYEKLLKEKENQRITILEIVENDEKSDIWLNNEVYYVNANEAYNNEFINKFNNKKFDFIIDRGSKRFKDQVFFLTNYLRLLKNNGVMIVEDIQSIRYVRYMYENVPDKFREYIKTYDLREVKGRYDDIMFVINRSSLSPDEIDMKELKISEDKNEVEPVKVDEKNNLRMDIYKLLLKRKRYQTTSVLDIGINDEEMIKYWLNYFPQSYIFGIGLKKGVDDELINNPRVKLYLDTNPVDINLNTSNVRFDLIIYNDDNNLDKLIFVCNVYSKLLKDDGMMIIDNIRMEDLEMLEERVPEDLKDYVEIYKLKMNNMLIINKTQVNK